MVRKKVMTVPYNHSDLPEEQIPLPIKRREFPLDDLLIPNRIEKRVSIPTAAGGRVTLLLRTDSRHLAKFFAMNWLADISPKRPDATIIALKKNAAVYGLARELDSSRWFCSKTGQVWMFGNEFYGNVKITVRGLCSELAPPEQMFLHGCALAIDGRGVVLSGVSGAGKTTLTAALRKILGSRAQVLNDDWGPFSLNDGQLQFTDEPYLHMKYPSVRTLAPHLEISPSAHPSENFRGDTNDPRARLLIAPHQVFGNNSLQSKAKLRMFVVVTRDPNMSAGVRSLSQRDMPLLEQGKYSRFYDRTEQFLNGSLFITDRIGQERERDRHRTLLKDFPCIMVNNVVAPEKTAELILTELERIAPHEK